MLRCLYIILREFLITYAKVTELIKWKHIYLYKYVHYINFVTLAYIIRNSLRMIYVGNSISKLQIQVITYVFELSAGTVTTRWQHYLVSL